MEGVPISDNKQPTTRQATVTMRSAWQQICNPESVIIPQLEMRTKLGQEWRGSHRQHMILAVASVGEEYHLPAVVLALIM